MTTCKDKVCTAHMMASEQVFCPLEWLPHVTFQLECMR